MIDSFSPGDFPANPLEKAGYRLERHDEFEGTELDTTLWLPYDVPHWSSRAHGQVFMIPPRPIPKPLLSIIFAPINPLRAIPADLLSQT